MEKLLTRNGVCKKLEYSPYTFTCFINGVEHTYNFSSELHLRNFRIKRENNFVMIYNDIYKRYKFRVDCQALSDCNLYNKIETRGCYIKIGNQVFTNIKDVNIKR